MVIVFFPSILAEVTGDRKITLDADTVGKVIENLVNMYGKSFEEKLFDQTGEWVRFWQIFVNGINIRFLDYFETSLDDEDELAFLPVIDGG